MRHETPFGEDFLWHDEALIKMDSQGGIAFPEFLAGERAMSDLAMRVAELERAKIAESIGLPVLEGPDVPAREILLACLQDRLKAMASLKRWLEILTESLCAAPGPKGLADIAFGRIAVLKKPYSRMKKGRIAEKGIIISKEAYLPLTVCAKLIMLRKDGSESSCAVWAPRDLFALEPAGD